MGESDSGLASLLARWKEAHARGHDLAAEQLCPDRPELARELARHIEALRGGNTAPAP